MGQVRSRCGTQFDESEAFGEDRWQADEANNGNEAPGSEAESQEAEDSQIACPAQSGRGAHCNLVLGLLGKRSGSRPADCRKAIAR